MHILLIQNENFVPLTTETRSTRSSIGGHPSQVVLTNCNLSSVCQAILLASEICGLETFLHAPDASGKA